MPTNEITLPLTGRKVMTGCNPTPRNVLGAAHYVFRKAVSVPPAPPNFDGTGAVKDWDIAGNDRYGDCVTAEEANYKKCIGPATGAVEVEIPASNVISWASAHGFLNGANLDDVLNAMEQDGLLDKDGAEHLDGTHGTIDWTNQEEFKSACSLFKCVKIAVSAGQLQAVVGNHSGWVLNGAYSDQNADHCVGIYGYGSVQFLADLCGVPAPAGIDLNAFAVLLYTWGTVGIVTWPSFLAITSEAWVRVTDPDRGDKATWDIEAADDFTAVTNTPPEPPLPPGPGPGPGPSPRPHPTRRGIDLAQKAQELFLTDPDRIHRLLDNLERELRD